MTRVARWDLDSGMASPPNKQTRELPKLTLRGTFAPGSFDAESRTVEVTWTTGSRGKRGYWNTYYEELSLDAAHVRMGRLNNKAPLLESHNGYSTRGVIGVVEVASVDGAEGTAKLRFASDGISELADEVFAKVRDGILTDVSVGYEVHEYTRVGDVEEGDRKIPVLRATDWEPYEISIVPMGFDPGANVRSRDADTSPCVIVDATRGATMDPDENKTEDNKTPEAPTVNVDAEREAAVLAERDRVGAVTRTTKALGLTDELAQEHIAKGTTADKFRELAIDARAKAEIPVAAANPSIEAVKGGDEADKRRSQMTAALLVRSGAAARAKAGAEKLGVKLDLDPGRYRGRSLLDMARMYLESRGVNTDGWSKMRLAGEALTHRGGYQATGDFPVALENALHKSLLGAYATAPDTWRRWCAQGQVSDFRAHPRYRPGSIGSLQVVAEGGEYKTVQAPDAEKESLIASKRGLIVSLTREAIINDDLGLFNGMARDVGRAAGRSIEVTAYAALAENGGLGPDMNDGNPLFHASHGNIGTGSAFTGAAIDADRLVMAQQQDPSSNEFLDLSPAVLLVPIALGSTARKYNKDTSDPDGSHSAESNPVHGMFKDIIDTPRLTDATRRYLFGDPADVAVMEVVFLDGNDTPWLETREGWTVDGVDWKVRMEFGVGAVDFRAAVTNAGS